MDIYIIRKADGTYLKSKVQGQIWNREETRTFDIDQLKRFVEVAKASPDLKGAIAEKLTVSDSKPLLDIAIGI